MSIDPIMTRAALITTENTGKTIQISGPEGVATAVRVDPHGVVLTFGDRQLSIHKELLPVVGRFFLAAGLLLGQDVNADWDGHQHKTGGPI